LFIAYHLGAKAICALTESGSTALWMSRHDVDIPIYALSQRADTRRKVALYRNVFAVDFAPGNDRDSALSQAERALLERGVVKSGDIAIMTIGEPMGSPGGTNTIKIVRVGQHLQ